MTESIFALVKSLKPDHPIGEHYGILDHGYVVLVDCMPLLGMDGAVLQAARVSYLSNKGVATTPEKDRGMLRYLMRHRHTTPFEMAELKFQMAMPIFVARQWIRHRTASVNEVSARYSVLPDRYYVPSPADVRGQSSMNKQMSEGTVGVDVSSQFVDWLHGRSAEHAAYESFTKAGVARELARMGLPLNLYTEWTWKIDLHNLLHFLSLRLDVHAQYEIRVYAEAMYKIVKSLAPLTAEAFEDYRLNAVTLSALEVENLRQLLNGGSWTPNLGSRATAREQDEWEVKVKRLGINK